jgi:hypothetical protein
MSSTTRNPWYEKWLELANFTGEILKEEEWSRRINEVIGLWCGGSPLDGWRRNLKFDFRDRDLCTPGTIYCRGDREAPNSGEHQIEDEIIKNRETLTFFSGEYCFEPIVNSFPCSKDCSGGREGNVEIDLLGILKTPTGAIHPLICEVKCKDNNPWYAAVENLRQLRLFIDNSENLEFIRKKCGNARMRFVAPVGIVLAGPDYYKSRGQKLNSMNPTQELLDRLQAQCKDARVILATWDESTKRVDRVAGWDLKAAFQG